MLLGVVMSAGATLVTLYVAASTAVGPILFEVSASHGVHLGDVIAGTVAFAAAGVVVAIVAEATGR